MEEARLNHLLRGLPRETASAGFTPRVLRRLDEAPRPDGERRRLLPQSQRWHRIMVATATVGALGVSVGVAVGVLQHQRSPLPLTAGLQASMANGPAAATGRGGVRMTAAALAAAESLESMDRTFRHESAAGGLAAAATGRRGSGQPAAAALLDAAEAHQLLRELRSERVQLERELHSLSRPGGAPPVLYLGGNESFDLVLNTGKVRAQGPPSGERDDGENFDYL